LLIIFGALLFSNVHNMDDFSEAMRTQQVPVTMIVLGTIILLISCFGCCGAIRQSYCMTMTVSTRYWFHLEYPLIRFSVYYFCSIPYCCLC